MNLTDNETLKFQKGTPVLFEDICAVFPVTLGQIVDEGYDNFQKYLGILTSNKPTTRHDADDEFSKLMETLTDFQYILLIAQLDSEIHDTLKNAFRFFTHEEAIFSLDPAQIVLGPISEKHIMNERNFYDFQRLLRRMYFIEVDGEEIIIYEDDLPQTKALKMKMRENREKVRRAKAKQNSKDGSDLKMSDLIGSMTLNNCGLNMVNIWDITYYAFHDQLKRMGWRDQFNINNQAALAGAKLKKSQLKHWMRSIANSDKS